MMKKKKKVLLVDDDRDFVEANKLILESKDYEVITAYDGENGKQKSLDAEPDVIVLDVMMETHQTGFEVARWLREQEATKTIPIVMLTAVNQHFPLNFDKDDIWLPVDEFLEKPVEPDRLLQVIQNKTDS